MAPLPPCGPYVRADGGEIEATIVVKAGPERSEKYGETVCTAALLDNGSLVRLYPVPWEAFWRNRLPKWVRVKVGVIPSDERAARPESHKVTSAFDESPSPLRTIKGKTPWAERTTAVARAVAPGGLAELREDQAKTHRSLGVVRVRELIDFWISAPLNTIVEEADYHESAQKTLDGTKRMEGSRIDALKHAFHYQWRCWGACCEPDAPGQGYHITTCEDWELFESFRQWRKEYPDENAFLAALKNRYYDEVGQTDLHFFMGTPSDPKTQNSWMIVGLFYPNRKKYDPARPSLCRRRDLAPGDILRPGSGEARRGARPKDGKQPKGLDAF